MTFYRRMWWVMSCAFMVYPFNRAGAQSLTWDDLLEKLTDQESENYSLLNNYYDDLCYLHEHPININTQSTEVLSQLPFLNAQQITEIATYVYSYGPIKSVGELNLIPYLDYDTRQLLALFITFGESGEEKKKELSFNNLLKYGKHEVLLRTDIPFQCIDEKYLGSSLYHSIRYHYKYGQKIEWGFAAKKDKGEPFFQGVDNGFDNYNYYFIIRDLGMLKTLALGDYRLKFGQGLVLNSQFSLGKTAALTQFNSIQPITKHSSVSETGYFQGVAAQFSWHNLNLYTYCSYLFQDASLNADSLITTLKTDGYHRTKSEINKKNNINSKLIGSHLEWNKNDFHIGLTTVWTLFNKKFISYPNNTHYKHFYPQGNSFFNMGMDYGYISYRWTFKGETAVDGNMNFATLNSLIYRPSSSLQFNVIQRYFDKKYNSLYGNSFGESSNVKNENGLYLGVVYRPLSKLKTMAYIDVYEFPWYRYLVSAKHSKGLDTMGQMEYSTSSGVDWLLKYRLKLKQQNYKNPVNEKQIALANRINQSIRLRAKYDWNDMQFSSQLDFTQFNLADLKAENGFAFSQQWLKKWNNPAIQWSVTGIYFNTDSYDSRVYSYERGLLYSFSFPSYYGHGYRLSTVFRYDINNRLMLLLKYGHTHYFNSYRQKLNDLQVQLRVKI